MAATTPMPTVFNAPHAPAPVAPRACGTACVGSGAGGQRGAAWRAAGWPAGRRRGGGAPGRRPASTHAPAWRRGGCVPLRAAAARGQCSAASSQQRHVRASAESLTDPPRHTPSHAPPLPADSCLPPPTCERIHEHHERGLLQAVHARLEQAQQQPRGEHQHAAAGGRRRRGRRRGQAIESGVRGDPRVRLIDINAISTHPHTYTHAHSHTATHLLWNCCGKE